MLSLDKFKFISFVFSLLVTLVLVLLIHYLSDFIIAKIWEYIYYILHNKKINYVNDYYLLFNINSIALKYIEKYFTILTNVLILACIVTVKLWLIFKFNNKYWDLSKNYIYSYCVVFCLIIFASMFSFSGRLYQEFDDLALYILTYKDNLTPLLYLFNLSLDNLNNSTVFTIVYCFKIFTPIASTIVYFILNKFATIFGISINIQIAKSLLMLVAFIVKLIFTSFIWLLLYFMVKPYFKLQNISKIAKFTAMFVFCVIVLKQYPLTEFPYINNYLSELLYLAIYYYPFTTFIILSFIILNTIYILLYLYRFIIGVTKRIKAKWQ